MSDETPILRADALDDDLQEFPMGGKKPWTVQYLSDSAPSAVTDEFKQRVDEYLTENDELMKRLALVDTAENGEFVVSAGTSVVAWEAYENGEGGWGFRPIYRSS